MVSFQTKNPNLGSFWRSLDWKMLIHFMAIWCTLQTIGIFYDHLVHFMFIWYFFRFWYHVPRKIWQPWSRDGASLSIWQLRLWSNIDWILAFEKKQKCTFVYVCRCSLSLAFCRLRRPWSRVTRLVQLANVNLGTAFENGTRGPNFWASLFHTSS
jgi:hypothetical protein